MFSVLCWMLKHKKLLKTEHQCKTRERLGLKKKIKKGNLLLNYWVFFSQNSKTKFSKHFFLNFFYVFWAKLKNRTLKSYWKPNTSVLLSTSYILQIIIHFGEFLLLWGLVSIILTIFFMGVERCDSYGNFGYLKRNQTFLF